MAQRVLDGLRPLRELPLEVEQIDSLDRVAGALANAVEHVAPEGAFVNEALSGTAFGHPLHPPLTDVVIGAWTSAVALDWLGGKRGGPAADWLVALGVVSALPTAAAGLNDWATLDGPTRRLGLVHGTTNVVATGLFGASWFARKTGRRTVGMLLALAGYGTVSVGAFLGGHLSFRRGVGVDHTAFVEAPMSGDGTGSPRGRRGPQSTRRERGSRQARAWRERVRAALTVLLAGFDAEPGLARLCLVETLKGGPPVLERRRVVTEALAAALDAGRSEPKAADPPPLTAESIVGGALSVVHSRLLARPSRRTSLGDGRAGTGTGGAGKSRTGTGTGTRMIELVNPLMSMIVLPYLGPAASRESSSGPRASPRPGSADGATARSLPLTDPFKDLPIRITFRTVRVISTIASSPARSDRNQEIGQDAGVGDQGQMSKLLHRLENAGLIENHGVGQARGEPNAWQLTSRGQGVLHAVGGTAHRSAPPPPPFPGAPEPPRADTV